MRKDEGRQMSKKDGEPQRKGEDMREEFKGKSSNYQEWDLGKGMHKKSFGSLAVCCVMPLPLRLLNMIFSAF